MPSEAVVVRAPEQPGRFFEAEAKQGQTGRPKAGADKSAPIGPKVKATRSRRRGEGCCPLIQINGPGFPRAYVRALASISVIEITARAQRLVRVGVGP